MPHIVRNPFQEFSMSQIKLSAVALAAMGLFAGAAQAQSTVIASSGASA
jgi:hypothetical protein